LVSVFFIIFLHGFLLGVLNVEHRLVLAKEFNSAPVHPPPPLPSPPWSFTRAPPLFQANLNKGKRTCLMAKKSRRKVKSKTSPPLYVSNDDNLGSSDEEDEDKEVLLNAMRKYPKARIKGLLGEVILHDELLDQQENLLIQEKESNQELKKLFKLEKEKNEKLDHELTQSK
jgi:hypothetical protein